MIVLLQQNSTWKYIVVSVGVMLAFHLARPHLEQILKLDDLQEASEASSSSEAGSDGAAATAGGSSADSCSICAADGEMCRDVEDVQNCLFTNAKRFLVRAQECQDIITQFQFVCSAKCCVEMMQTTLDTEKHSAQEIAQLKTACEKWIDDIKARMMSFVVQEEEDEDEDSVGSGEVVEAAVVLGDEEEIVIPLTKTAAAAAAEEEEEEEAQPAEEVE